jgi:hypothetical protein
MRATRKCNTQTKRTGKRGDETMLYGGVKFLASLSSIDHGMSRWLKQTKSADALSAFEKLLHAEETILKT